jgi:hypothetical protein
LLRLRTINPATTCCLKLTTKTLPTLPQLHEAKPQSVKLLLSCRHLPDLRCGCGPTIYNEPPQRNMAPGRQSLDPSYCACLKMAILRMSPLVFSHPCHQCPRRSLKFVLDLTKVFPRPGESWYDRDTYQDDAYSDADIAQVGEKSFAYYLKSAQDSCRICRLPEILRQRIGWSTISRTFVIAYMLQWN